MVAVDLPMLRERKIPLKVVQQMRRGHGSAGEKVPCHPIFVVLCHKVVRERLVRKYVHKKLALGLEERGHLGEEALVILHVLKHFDRYDTIKRSHILRELKVPHVSSENLHVIQPTLGSLGHDVLSLGVGIAYSNEC